MVAQAPEDQTILGGHLGHVPLLSWLQVPEAVVAQALQLGQAQLGPIISAQLDLAERCGRPKRVAPLFEVPAAALEQLTVRSQY